MPKRRQASASQQFDTALAVARVRKVTDREKAGLEQRIQVLEESKGQVEKAEIARIASYLKRAAGPRAGHYESGNTGRWDHDWTSTADSPYNDINGSLDKTIARSRRLVANCGFAESAVNVIIDNVVADGIRPIPIVRKDNGEENEKINKDLRESWNYFNDEFDRTRRSTFYECERLALSTIINCGSVLTNQVAPGRQQYLPIAYQMREPDRLDRSHDYTEKSISNNAPSKQVCHGVMLDEYDVSTGYYFQGVTDAISSQFVKMAFRRKRPEQYIGMPWWAPVLKRMWDVQNLIEDQAIKSRITAMIALWLEGDSGGLPPIGPENSEGSFDWSPGSVGRGPIGSAPKVVQADDKLSDGYYPFIILLLREFAATNGLSYYSIAKDIQGMNFAGTRAVILDERRAHYGSIKWFTKEWCQPHYNDFVKWSVITGKIRNLTIDKYMEDPHRYNECYWVPRPWDWVDPVADVEALIKLKEAGLLADEMYLAPRGIGVREFYEKLGKEKDWRKEFGIKDPTTEGQQSNGKTQQEQEDDDKKEPVQTKLALFK
jgi:lambda family phage portal protein